MTVLYSRLNSHALSFTGIKTASCLHIKIEQKTVVVRIDENDIRCFHLGLSFTDQARWSRRVLKLLDGVNNRPENSSRNMICHIKTFRRNGNNLKNLRQQIGRDVVSYWSYSVAKLITGLLRRSQQLFAIQTASRRQATVVTMMDGQRSRRRNLKVKPAPIRRLESPTATEATSVTLGNKRRRTTREWGKCGRTASMSSRHKPERHAFAQFRR